MATPQEKARKARNLATEQFGGVDTYKTRQLVNQNAKSAGKKLTAQEETRAAKIMQPRRQNDRDRTAARAAFITGPNSPASKRAAAAAVTAGVAGSSKKAAAKPKPTATAKPKIKVTAKPAAKKTGPINIKASATTSGGGKKTTSVTGASSMSTKPKKVN